MFLAGVSSGWHVVPGVDTTPRVYPDCLPYHTHLLHNTKLLKECQQADGKMRRLLNSFFGPFSFKAVPMPDMPDSTSNNHKRHKNMVRKLPNAASHRIRVAYAPKFLLGIAGVA